MRIAPSWVLAAAMVLGGCFDVAIGDGQYACVDGKTCPPGFVCDCDARCVAASPVDVTEADLGRVPGAVVLYLFDEGRGTTVRDRATGGEPFDLCIDGASPAWQPGSLTIAGETRITRDAPPDKLRAALSRQHEFTIETWITPAEAAQQGPRRIVSLSEDHMNQSLMVGQGSVVSNEPERAVYVLRLRTSELTGGNANTGQPALEVDVAPVTALTHLVLTRAADGAATCYVDGAMAGLDPATRPGDFTVWPASHRLILGNELIPADDDKPRFWPGTFHLVAVYDRVLDAGEVAQNFAATSDPELAR